MAAPPPKPDFESDDEVADPDEDDLDDLDDMLDEFSATTLGGAAAASVAAAATAETAGAAEEDMTEEEFAKHLSEGMASLLSGMGADSKEMQEQFADIFKQVTSEAAAAAATESDSTSTAPNTTATPKAAPSTLPKQVNASRPGTSHSTNGADFQDTIRKTIERMQTSGDQATAAAAADGSDDFLSELLKQMGGSGGGLPGMDAAGGEEDFSKMLMGMMEQLTDKEILYEPMKDLDKAFPEWMEKNKATITEEDKKRYEVQQQVVREIVAKFEEPSFSDKKPEDRQYIVERMQKMQDAGSPPPDLVGDMPSAQDAFGAPGEDDCNPQ